MWLLHLHNTVKMQTFSQDFPFGGIHSQGILLVIPLKLQEKKHQPFSRTQPFDKTLYKRRCLEMLKD